MQTGFLVVVQGSRNEGIRFEAKIGGGVSIYENNICAIRVNICVNIDRLDLILT